MNETPPTDTIDILFLDGAQLHFRSLENRLQLKMTAEEEWREVSLVRLFPLTALEQWIAIIDVEDKEIGILRDLNTLSPQSLECAQNELYRRYLIPRIERILACRDRFDLIEWEVETNRGHITFLMRHPHENIKQQPPNRLALTDVEGNRYDIDDINTLDEESRKMLELRL